MSQLQHIVPPIERSDSTTGVIEALDLTGDTKVHWDKNNPGEVAAAEASFNVLIGKGYAAFKLQSDGETAGQQIREFDPNAERILMRPPMQGG